MENLFANNRSIWISYLLVAIAIITLFILHLMQVVIAALVGFLLINKLHSVICEKSKSKNAHNLTLLVISVIVVGLLSFLGVGIYSSLRMGTGNFETLSLEAMKVVNQIKTYLPENLLKYIPDDIFALKTKVAEFTQEHMSAMLHMTSASIKNFASVLLGFFVGGVVAFSFLHTKNENSQAINLEKYPYLNECKKRLEIFANIFAKVGGAQIKISAINTVLTAIYLLIILPLTGNHIQYATTLVICTFIFGIIPVLGNLISNTLIFLMSLLVSFPLAICSIIFLIVVHKLEYYINAKIVGSEIKTSIWELLIAMIVMQAIFGVIGVVLAPVIYGYIKEELKYHNLIPN